MPPGILVVSTQHLKTEQKQDNKKRRLGRDSKPKFWGAIYVSLQGHHGFVI
jgi:hypothetical protein